MIDYQHKNASQSIASTLENGNTGTASLMPPPLQFQSGEAASSDSTEIAYGTGGYTQITSSEGKGYDHDVNAQHQLQNMAPLEMLLELAAHDIAYKANLNAVSPDIKLAFWNSGFDMNGAQFFAGTRGFRAVLIHPRQGENLNPILAIRGTNGGPSRDDLETIATDLNHRAVGWEQFVDNIDLINQIFAQVGTRVDITGHSLGGAVAQLITVNYPGYIGIVSTFQSPGIDQESINQYNAIPYEYRPVEINHHIVTGDIVDKAGDAHLPGDVFEHDFGDDLNIHTLLHELTTKTQTFNQAHVLYDVATRQNPRQIQARANELQRAALDLQNFISSTIEQIVRCHGIRVFSAAPYQNEREAQGVPVEAFGNGEYEGGNRSNHLPSIGRFPSHPRANEMATTEQMRSTGGPLVQSLFVALFAAQDVINGVFGK